jgi:hypothetical protein
MDLLGTPRRRAHRCGTCLMWEASPDGLSGICENGDPRTLQGFEGEAVETPEGFRTPADTYCDHQVPTPPPGPPCPKCGTPVYEGFGLAGGGYGAYAACDAEGCGYFEKWECHD